MAAAGQWTRTSGLGAKWKMDLEANSMCLLQACRINHSFKFFLFLWHLTCNPLYSGSIRRYRCFKIDSLFSEYLLKYKVINCVPRLHLCILDMIPQTRVCHDVDLILAHSPEAHSGFPDNTRDASGRNDSLPKVARLCVTLNSLIARHIQKLCAYLQFKYFRTSNGIHFRIYGKHPLHRF